MRHLYLKVTYQFQKLWKEKLELVWMNLERNLESVIKFLLMKSGRNFVKLLRT